MLPDALVIDGRAPVKPDAAIGELAELLHDRLIGELTIERDADATDWRTLLLLLSRTPEELIAEGGIAKAWAAYRTRRTSRFARSTTRRCCASAQGADGAAWDRIIEFCLQGDDDERHRRASARSGDGALDDPIAVRRAARRRVQAASGGGASIGARARRCSDLIRKAIERLPRARDDSTRPRCCRRSPTPPRT